MLGAEIVGEVPDVGGGPFGMARLAHIMHERLTPSRGERPGRPTDPSWVTRCKVPMSDATLHRLTELAEEMSTAERKVSPMQVAAQLLEEAVSRVGESTPVHAARPAGALADVQIASRGPNELVEKQPLPTPSKLRQRGKKPQAAAQKPGLRQKKA
jgi:hypothetical protein